MKTTGNTILVTGGSSGIGMQIAAQLLALGNTVIVTGRDPERLAAVKARHPRLDTIQSDVSDPGSIAQLHALVLQRHPSLNVLVNNAGVMRKLDLQHTGADLSDISRELETNLAGPIRMVQQFLPQLSGRDEAAIVNVSSGLAFVPFPIAPIYSATKAGLHAYTQSLRVQLKDTRIKVFELAPPGARTPLMDTFSTDVADNTLMDPEKVAQALIRAMQKNRLEIRPGISNVLKILSRIAPGVALKMLSRPMEAMRLGRAAGN